MGGNHGTPNGAVTFAAGKVGKAFLFDGKSWVNAPAAGLPTGSAQRTMELWARVDKTYSGQVQGLFAGYGTWGSLNALFSLLVDGRFSTPNRIIFSQWGDDVLATAPAVVGQWHHVAVTYAGGSASVYVDGALSSSKAIAVATASGQTYLGGYPSSPSGQPTEWLTGAVDEVSIYSRALSAGEIGQIYTAGAAGKCP